VKWKVHKRLSLVALAITALVALLVHLLLHISFWIAWGFTLLGLLINGIVATIEDNRPGGFNNPKNPPSEDS